MNAVDTKFLCLRRKCKIPTLERSLIKRGEYLKVSNVCACPRSFEIFKAIAFIFAKMQVGFYTCICVAVYLMRVYNVCIYKCRFRLISFKPIVIFRDYKYTFAIFMKRNI